MNVPPVPRFPQCRGSSDPSPINRCAHCGDAIPQLSGRFLGNNQAVAGFYAIIVCGQSDCTHGIKDKRFATIYDLDLAQLRS